MIDPLFLESAISARQAFLTEPHTQACRLFNGFYEGCPELLVDLYGTTLVLFDYADPPRPEAMCETLVWLRARLPWVEAAVVKTRTGNPEERRGVLAFGKKPASRIQENGVWYSVDLQMNQDAGFYLDTRGLRAWLKQHSAGLSVLNTFAYTGSLGVAALAGGAQRVLQTDLDPTFLQTAQRSYQLNGLPNSRKDFWIGDFFSVASRLRYAGQRFDLILLDPPFFSSTSGGRIDQLHQSARLINKVRPLVVDGGRIVAINNALFLSGADYLYELEALCAGGYVAIQDFIPVPEDITGYAHTRRAQPPVNPAPFNHPTKIVILKVHHQPNPGSLSEPSG